MKHAHSSTLNKLIIALAALSTAGIAQAGAMGPVAAPIDWTGAYFGVNAGGGYLQGDYYTRVDGSLFNTLPSNASAIVAASAGRKSDTSLIGGFQVGYNYQPNWSRIVLGIVADVDFGNLNATRNTVTTGTTFGVGAVHQTIAFNWLGTARGNIGVAFNQAQVYATGGFLLTKMTNSYELCFNGFFCNRASGNSTLSGTVFGFGADYTPSKNWIIGAVALWGQPKKHLLYTNAINNLGAVVANTDLVTFSRPDYVAARVNVSYRFDDTPGDLG